MPPDGRASAGIPAMEVGDPGRDFRQEVPARATSSPIGPSGGVVSPPMMGAPVKLWIVLLAALWAAGPAFAQGQPAEETEKTPEEIAAEEAAAAEAAAAEAAATAAAARAEELAALKAAIEAQAELLQSQQKSIEDLNAQLQQTKLKLIPKDEIKFSMKGHYRVRGHVFNHLYASQSKPNGDYIGDGRYMNQRLWLQPGFNYKDLAKAFVEVRALDNVMFGDNRSNASTALFAGLPSETNIDGVDQAPIFVSRAWMEISIPVGLLRIGRQPSQWGMGLLANDGNGFRNIFGEAKFSSTNDRVLFATKPLAIYQKIAGKPDSGTPLFAVVALDRLVEDPLIQYYGFKCTAGIPDSDADYDRRCDPDGDGITTEDHSYTDDTFAAENRSPDWWVDQNDDVWEMVYVLVYRGEKVRYVGGTGDLTAGVWGVHRKQQETDSNVLILDAYVSSKVHGTIIEFEGISIAGTSRAIALPGSTNESGKGDPLTKDVGIAGYVARLGYEQPSWKFVFEHGFASGDEAVTDRKFTGRPLNPDHNVGLLLYEEVISRVTQVRWTDSANGLWSNGGVYNSRYIFPTAHVYPLDNWELVAGYVRIWPHKPDGALIACNDDDEGCQTPSSQQPESKALGYEFDFAVKHRWHEHVLLSLETGFAKATDRLPLEGVGLNPEGKFFTFQSRIAYEF